MLATCRRCISRLIRETGFRELEFSREGCLKPQITLRLLTDTAGPLMVEASIDSREKSEGFPRLALHVDHVKMPEFA